MTPTRTDQQSVPGRAAAVGGDLVAAVVAAVAVTVAALALGAAFVGLVFFWSVVFGPEQAGALREQLSGDVLVYAAQVTAAPILAITVVIVMVKRARRRQGWL